VLALAATKDEAVIRSIENAAQADPNPLVSAAAKSALVVRDPPATGVLVIRMNADGNAEASGIRPGDIITAYNGRAVASNDELVRERDAVAGSGIETVPVVVTRAGREQTIQVKPGRLGLSDVRSVTKK
jgi:S1-C subfamily serine protease